MTGLPDEAKPVINIQLSSPIESQTITQLYDPLNPELDGSLAEFKGVEIENATITMDVSDADIPLGSSAVLDVKPLTEIDVMGGGSKVVKKMEIAIVPGGGGDDAGVAEAETETGTEAGSDVKVEEAEEGDGDVEVVAQSAENVAEEDTGADADVETADSDEEFVDAKSELNDAPSKSEEGEAEVEAEAEEEEKSEEGVEVEVEGEQEAVEAAADDEAEAKVEVAEESAATEETKDEDKEEITETDAEVVEKPADEEAEGKGEESKPEDENTTESDEKAEEPEEKVVEETKEAPTPSTSTSALVPTCFVHSQIEFIPSAKDKKDELYVLLNKASKQKASAVDKLRKSAAALNRSRMMEATTKSGGASASASAVKSGFLNKKTPKKEPMFLVRWYEKTLGPNSMLRKVYPIAKNYVLFFGGVALMHFQGQQLSLPPPV